MHKAPSTSLGMRSAGSAFRRAARMPRNRLNFGSGLRRPLGRPNFVGSHSLANESASSGDPVGLCPTGQPRAAVPTCFVALYAHVSAPFDCAQGRLLKPCPSQKTRLWVARPIAKRRAGFNYPTLTSQKALCLGWGNRQFLWEIKCIRSFLGSHSPADHSASSG